MRSSWKRIFSTASLALCFLASGCGEAFEEVPIATIEHEAQESRMATAVSWWYAGERDGYHYVVIKRTLDQRRYKVRTTELTIDLPHKELAFAESEWVNLKFGQMQFKAQ
jgi:hypothetical protein